MKYKTTAFLFLLLVIIAPGFGMELSETLAGHNPKAAAVHERALRGFKASTSKNIAVLTAAIDYFEALPCAQPTSTSDCYVIDEHKQFAYTPKFWLRQCQAAKIIIEHLKPQVEKAFQDLLRLELNKIDKARWPEIQKVLPYDSSLKLHSDEQLMDALIKLAHDPKADYTKWFRIIASYKDRTAPKVANQEKAPKPQTSATSKQTVFVKKKKKKKSPTQALPEASAENPLFPAVPTPRDLLWLALLSRDHVKVAQILTEFKGKVDSNESSRIMDFTPLHYAVSANNKDLCHVLLEHGANPNLPSTLYLKDLQCHVATTPLMLAANTGRIERVRELLAYGADPNIPALYIPSGQKEYALTCAAAPFCADDRYTSETQIEMVKLLLQNGINEWNGHIYLYITHLKNMFELDLKSAYDQMIIQSLLLNQEASKTISCYDGKITLIAHANFFEEEKKENDKILSSNDSTKDN